MEHAFAVAPVLLDLDPEVEEDARAEQRLDVLARQSADLLEHCALGTDDDALLRVALDVDRRADVDITIRPRRHLIRLDGHRMRHLVARELQDLLADELGDDEALRLVRDHVLRIVLRALRQVLLDLRQQGVEIRLRLGRDRHDTDERVLVSIARDDRQDLLLLDEVELVDDEDDGLARRLQALEDVVLARAHLLRRIDDEENGIDFLECALGCLDHVLAELVLRLVDARRVEEDNLGIGFRQDAEDAVLVKRYKETRRSHPLAQGERVDKGIMRERQKMEFLKKEADYIIDTSRLLTRELKTELEKIFVQDEEFNSMYVTILSFGFKYGIPADSDIVMDVRFLPNPYYVEELRPKTGNDVEIQQYVMKYDEAKIFLNKLEDMVTFLIPHYISEGKNQLVISIGCTGGKHRSVTLANELYKRLSQKKNREYGLKIEHRDIGKDALRGK